MPGEAAGQCSLRLSGRAICLAVSTKYFTGAFDYFTFRAKYATMVSITREEQRMKKSVTMREIGAALGVPEDVSVTGFDNFIYATLSTPPLTTYSVDQGRMAQVAVRRLLSRIKDGPEGPLRTIVGGWIVERASIRDPRADNN